MPADAKRPLNEPINVALSLTQAQHMLNDALAENAKLIDLVKKHEAMADEYEEAVRQRSAIINRYRLFYSNLVATFFGRRQARKAEERAGLDVGWRV